MLIASFLFAIMNVMVKYLKHIPVSQIVLMRSVVMFVLVTTLLAKKRIAPFGKRKGLLIMRGVFGSFGIALFFYTLHYMPLASAVVVHYLTPIFTTIIAFFLLKEKIRPVQWIFFAICLIGIYVIKGFDPRIDGWVLLLGIVGTIAAASAYNVIGLLRETEHHLVIMLYFPLVTIPLVLIYMWVTGEWAWGVPTDWILLISIGVLTYGAQYFLTRSFQLGAMNKVSITSYLGVVYALVFGYFFFDEWYRWEAFMGVLLVLLGVSLNVFFKQR